MKFGKKQKIIISIILVVVLLASSIFFFYPSLLRIKSSYWYQAHDHYDVGAFIEYFTFDTESDEGCVYDITFYDPDGVQVFNKWGSLLGFYYLEVKVDVTLYEIGMYTCDFYLSWCEWSHSETDVPLYSDPELPYWDVSFDVNRTSVPEEESIEVYIDVVNTGQRAGDVTLKVINDPLHTIGGGDPETGSEWYQGIYGPGFEFYDETHTIPVDGSFSDSFIIPYIIQHLRLALTYEGVSDQGYPTNSGYEIIVITYIPTPTPPDISITYTMTVLTFPSNCDVNMVGVGVVNSGDDGIVIFEDVPYGSYDVTVSKAGYPTFTETVFINDDATISMDLTSQRYLIPIFLLIMVAASIGLIVYCYKKKIIKF